MPRFLKQIPSLAVAGQMNRSRILGWVADRIPDPLKATQSVQKKKPVTEDRGRPSVGRWNQSWAGLKLRSRPHAEKLGPIPTEEGSTLTSISGIATNFRLMQTGQRKRRRALTHPRLRNKQIRKEGDQLHVLGATENVWCVAIRKIKTESRRSRNKANGRTGRPGGRASCSPGGLAAGSSYHQ